MELEIYNIKGQKTSRTINLDDVVFHSEPNDHAIYLDAKQFLANRRQGTHKSKEKWEISASTKKLKKQKGTGGARAGSNKSPLVKGGGRVFGPQPRDYHFKLNKKLKVVARRSALSYKVLENKITVIEDFTFETPKTKSYLELLSNFSLSGQKTLLVLKDNDQNVVLSGRNIPKTKVMNAVDLNTFEILNAAHLLITEGSIKEIERINQ